MSAFGRPFTESIIHDLARRPDALPSVLGGKSGFSYPQRGWLYRSAAARYEGDGSIEAMWNRLDSEIGRGKGPTPWKTHEAAIVRDRLTSMVAMERGESAKFVRSLYLDHPTVVTWRGHEVAMRVGLEFTMTGEWLPAVRRLFGAST